MKKLYSHTSILAISSKCLAKKCPFTSTFIQCMCAFLFGVFGDSGAWPNHTVCLLGYSELSSQIKAFDHHCQTAHSLKSYLFICESVDVLMVRAEQHVPQNWLPFAHHHVLIQQCRLGNGVHQDLKEAEDRHLMHIKYCPDWLWSDQLITLCSIPASRR